MKLTKKGDKKSLCNDLSPMNKASKSPPPRAILEEILKEIPAIPGRPDSDCDDFF